MIWPLFNYLVASTQTLYIDMNSMHTSILNSVNMQIIHSRLNYNWAVWSRWSHWIELKKMKSTRIQTRYSLFIALHLRLIMKWILYWLRLWALGFIAGVSLQNVMDYRKLWPIKKYYVWVIYRYCIPYNLWKCLYVCTLINTNGQQRNLWAQAQIIELPEKGAFFWLQYA